MSSHDILGLEAAIITGELGQRPARPADYQAENRALTELLDAMAAQPAADDMFQRLAETTLMLCRAHSAGVSLLETGEKGEELFRWRAAAGQWSVHRGEEMPRASPCGAAVDRGEVLLMAHPERHYAYVRTINLPLAEVLLVPFHSQGKPVGTLWIISHDETLKFDGEDLRLLTGLSRLAASIYRLLKQERLATDLADTERLHRISTQLLVENRIDVLYQKIVDAAAAIMRSDFASIQLYHAERGLGGELKLLAYRGFDREAASHWEWVNAASTTSCGASLRTRRREIVPDIEASDFLAGTVDLEAFRRNGIRSVQTTPLLSRAGDIVGVISTHWSRPHRPSARDLRLFDVLARQASDLIERSMAEDHARLLLREVNHRAKNLLAVVQAIARQTAGNADPATFAEQFCSRLAGISASQDLLVENNWEGVAVGDLVRSQLHHLGNLVDSRIRLDGPAVKLIPAAAQSLGMALYELSTNSVKYGALSNGAGSIAIDWGISDDAAQPRFLMGWQESGGPPVAPPRRRGFGHSVIVRSIEHALDASVDLEFLPAGLTWRVDAPADAVLDSAGSSTISSTRTVMVQ